MLLTIGGAILAATRCLFMGTHWFWINQGLSWSGDDILSQDAFLTGVPYSNIGTWILIGIPISCLGFPLLFLAKSRFRFVMSPCLMIPFEIWFADVHWNNLVGGFKHQFYFPFHIWDNPSHWLIFFKMVIAPPTSIIIYRWENPRFIGTY